MTHPKRCIDQHKLVESKWFVAGTDYHSIIKHEIGHVVANKYNIDGLVLGKEIISECFAGCVYGSGLLNEFALKFVEKMW